MYVVQRIATAAFKTLGTWNENAKIPYDRLTDLHWSITSASGASLGPFSWVANVLQLGCSNITQHTSNIGGYSTKARYTLIANSSEKLTK